MKSENMLKKVDNRTKKHTYTLIKSIKITV